LRNIRREDLRECFSLERSHSGEEIVGFQRAIAVWESLAACGASLHFSAMMPIKKTVSATPI
jgi:hypothetical protein